MHDANGFRVIIGRVSSMTGRAGGILGMNNFWQTNPGHYIPLPNGI